MFEHGRFLTLEVRRNSCLDHSHDRIRYSGITFCWPDGRPVSTGVSKLCQVGTRVLLGKRFGGDRLLVEIWVVPTGEDAPRLDLPKGLRSCRLMLKRLGQQGVIHLFDRTPTDLIFDDGVDEAPVLQWIGLASLAADEEFWLDVFVKPV